MNSRYHNNTKAATKTVLPPLAPRADVYVVDSSDMAKLRAVEKKLHGNGTPLTPDERRDLANMLSATLSGLPTVGEALNF